MYAYLKGWCSIRIIASIVLVKHGVIKESVDRSILQEKKVQKTHFRQFGAPHSQGRSFVNTSISQLGR